MAKIGVRVDPFCELRQTQWLAVVFALTLLMAQWLLAAHATKHALAEPDERHHCPFCIQADHSPAVAASAASVPAGALETPPPDSLEQSPGFSAPRSTFPARAPPALTA